MSELIHTHDNRATIRWKLLTSASALALMVTSVSVARAEDTDRPTVWIELSGELEHVSGQGANFPVAFLAAYPDASVLQGTTPLQAQNPPPFSFAEKGKISFQPESSDWVFSAAVNYGRSSNFRHVDHQTSGIHYKYYLDGVPKGNVRGTDDFSDTHVHHRGSHAVLDFSVGKDVGLGMFGRGASSVLNFGVRFAQFSSSATFDVRARPDLKTHNITFGTFRIPLLYFHTYHNTGDASRNFHGIGPSLSWNGSAPFAGNPQNGEIALDWGANAAILFGKQKARVRHQEAGHFEAYQCELGCSSPYAVVYQRSGGHSTARSVTVPNVGGFVGASYRIENFKVSLGYRADFFFGAMDTGIDTCKSATLGFRGPYASISVGLGD